MIFCLKVHGELGISTNTDIAGGVVRAGHKHRSLSLPINHRLWTHCRLKLLQIGLRNYSLNLRHLLNKQANLKDNIQVDYFS
jgi:hypothetical protein